MVYGVLFLVAVAVALFLLFRVFVLWYWRVNAAIEVLERIDKKLESIDKRLSGKTGSPV